MPYTAKVFDVSEDLIKEHAHLQFKAFKSARKEAATKLVLTVHIDWSKNAKLRQAREEKMAYYSAYYNCCVYFGTSHR